MPTRFVLLLSLFLGTASSSVACRLPHRLLIQQRPTTQPSLIMLSASFQQTAFDISHVSGYYSQVTPRLEFRNSGRLLIGSDFPVTALHRDDQSANTFGLGNPVGFGQYRVLSSNGNEASIGLQIEVPLGSHEDGLASDHFEFLPHLTYAHAAGWIGVSTDIGVRHSLGSTDHHDDEESPLFVDPHADSELLYRLGLLFYHPVIGVTPSVYIDGQRRLGGEAEYDWTAAMGFVVGWTIADSYVLAPAIEFPVTDVKRMNWTFRLSAEARM